MKRVDVRRTWVPGPGGYVIAFVIACAFYSLGLVVHLVASSSSGVQLAVYAPAVTVLCCVAVAPVGALWAAIVHVTCRRVRAEAVHVLVAGLVAAALAPPWLYLLFHRDSWGAQELAVVAAGSGVCGALGRGLARRWVRRPDRPARPRR